jgi:hypothetical protein
LRCWHKSIEFYKKVLKYKMKQSEEIKLELFQGGFLEDKPDLLLVDIPRELDLQKGNLPRILNKNEIFIFVYHPYYDTKVNTTFDILYVCQDIENFIEVKCTLKYVSVNPSYEIDYIPAGFSALCLFEFENGIPEIIKKLPIFMEKRDSLKHESLVLTQKAVWEKLKLI